MDACDRSRMAISSRAGTAPIIQALHAWPMGFHLGDSVAMVAHAIARGHKPVDATHQSGEEQKAMATYRLPETRRCRGGAAIFVALLERARLIANLSARFATCAFHRQHGNGLARAFA